MPWNRGEKSRVTHILHVPRSNMSSRVRGVECPLRMVQEEHLSFAKAGSRA
jgi:hypothetical protein